MAEWPEELIAPSAPYGLPFDISAMTAEPYPAKAFTAVDGDPCRAWMTWSSAYAAVPERERRRDAFVSYCYGKEDTSGDPYREFLRLYRAIAKRVREVDLYDLPRDLEHASDDQLTRYVDGNRCLGVGPARDVVAELQRRDERRKKEAEEARCAADPSCVAERRRESLERLRFFICGHLTGKAEAKAGAREERKTARQVGMVNLVELHDLRRLYDIHDVESSDGMAEWKAITGKAFQPRRDCPRD